MYYSQQDENIVNADQKTVATISGSNVVDPEQQVTNTKKNRLEKAVIRLSSRGTLYQIILSLPTFGVELNYGIRYSNQCPIQPLIIVFLIVHGTWSLVNGLILLSGFIIARYIKRLPTASPTVWCLLRVNLIAELISLIFGIAWLVPGQVWVFGAQRNGFQSSDSTQSATYCYGSVFWTGFSIIIITYGIWLIIIVVLVVRYLINRHKNKQGIASTTDEPH